MKPGRCVSMKPGRAAKVLNDRAGAARGLDRRAGVRPRASSSFTRGSPAGPTTSIATTPTPSALTDHGVQMFDYRGSTRISTPGEVVTLYPDETHDGRAGTREGFGYRIVYVQPARLSEALRAAPRKAVAAAVRARARVDRRSAVACRRAGIRGAPRVARGGQPHRRSRRGRSPPPSGRSPPRAIDHGGRRARPAAARRRVHPRHPLDASSSRPPDCRGSTWPASSRRCSARARIAIR